MDLSTLREHQERLAAALMGLGPDLALPVLVELIATCELKPCGCGEAGCLTEALSSLVTHAREVATLGRAGAKVLVMLDGRSAPGGA